jgi:hypothetical protein
LPGNFEGIMAVVGSWHLIAALNEQDRCRFGCIAIVIDDHDAADALG